MAACYFRREEKNLKRRTFLKAAGLTAAAPGVSLAQATKKDKPPPGILVNDVHGQLSSARVFAINRVDSLEDVAKAFATARAEEKNVCIAGGRHSMGGQPFADQGVMIDTRKLAKVLAFDTEKGHIEVESGMMWPQLLDHLSTVQRGLPQHWTFSQKQTGVDRVTIGGSLSANIHGRGLALPPFIGDIESFKLFNAAGQLLTCSRTQNPELFRLAIGGFGLFGFVYSVTLRLVPRRKVERVVEVRDVAGLVNAFAERVRDGFTHGEFQYAIDDRSEDFLRKGVFTCFRPVSEEMQLTPARKDITERERIDVLYLAHTDKASAFRRWSELRKATGGQVLWSDEAQMTAYPENYHRELEKRYAATNRASEVTTELCCDREALEPFLADVREYVRRDRVEIINGSIRLIEQDQESFLPWARKPYACVSFNLHVEHSTRGSIRAGDAFRRLINIGVKHGGSYYLAYHRHALRQQIDACYPRFREFLLLKRKYDKDELFQSDWYRHYRRMYFGDR
jgi:FAD/FMN-containing dehydrogenase